MEGSGVLSTDAAATDGSYGSSDFVVKVCIFAARAMAKTRVQVDMS